MTFGGNGIGRSGRGERLLSALVVAAMLVFAISTSAWAQMFTDHPPPIPPGLVPDPGSAINLAPSAGPASIPSLPAPLAQPSAAAVPPVVAPPSASTAGQTGLVPATPSGKEPPLITGRPVRPAEF